MNETDYYGGLSIVDDLPFASRPPIEGFIENYWWIAHDLEQNMGLMVHFGTMRHDFDVIRQTVMVFLPDGKVATDISYATARREQHFIAASTLSMECLVPFRQWHIESKGMLQISDTKSLWQDSAKQGPRVPGEFSIEGSCIGPVWSPKAGSDEGNWQQQKWASSHYQQTIRLSGKVSVDGRDVEFDGTGVRDHSRGPRDFTGSWTGHFLCSAPFSNHRSFGIMANYGPENLATYKSAYVVVDGKMTRGVPSEVKRLSRDILDKEGFIIELELPTSVETIHVETFSCGLLSMLLPCDTVIGIYRDRGFDIGLGYALSKFTWGEHIGVGIVERSSLVSMLPV